MNDKFTANATVTINTPAAKVWEALTTPEIIKQYLFGAEVISDWKAGGPIIYKGLWQGKPYEDKGKILKIEPRKLLSSTYWSPLSGLPNKPENYHTVTYQLSERDGRTQLTLTQDNNASVEEQAHSEQNWKMVLEGLKKTLEG